LHALASRYSRQYRARPKAEPLEELRTLIRAAVACDFDDPQQAPVPLLDQ